MLIDEAFDNLAGELKKHTGIDVHVCYQCGKCSAGCPTAGHMDHLPNQIVHLAQLGCRRRILESNSLWNCISCGTCSSRCPKNIDILGIFDAFRAQAFSKRLNPRNRGSSLYYKLFLHNIARNGRLSEMELGAMYNLKSGHLLQDMTLAPKMFLDGKLHILPHRIKNSGYLKKLIKRTEQGELT
ncbi:MAG: 4Fe-4S dicluster domain-containing protein [bacterium]